MAKKLEEPPKPITPEQVQEHHQAMTDAVNTQRDAIVRAHDEERLDLVAHAQQIVDNARLALIPFFRLRHP
jgi:hypothetical protein